jgi:hypothetical protein
MFLALLFISFGLPHVMLTLLGVGWVTFSLFGGSLFGMTNEVYQDRPDDAEWFPCPTDVTSGMAVLIGKRPAVALDAYDSNRGGTTFRFTGSFSLTVIGQSTQSPNSIQALNPGDRIFASGSFDATTNVTRSLTLDGTRGNVPFGSLGNDSVAAGQTKTTALVKLLGGVGTDTP